MSNVSVLCPPPLPPTGGSTLCLKDNLLHCSLSELSLSLSRFVSEWRRVDGDGFSPDALFYVCLSLQKVIRLCLQLLTGLTNICTGGISSLR